MYRSGWTGVNATVGTRLPGHQSVAPMAHRLRLLEALCTMFPQRGPAKGFGHSSWRYRGR